MRTTGVFSITALALLIAAPASAQFELTGAGYFDAVKVTTPGVAENRGSLLVGLQAGYRTAPWSFAVEYAGGGSLERSEMQRSRAELTIGYSPFRSIDLVAGARHEDIMLNDVFYFFFLPIVEPEAEVQLTNFFVGFNYESDPLRKTGLVAAARVYQGSADVSTRSRPAESDDSEGFRGELGFRIGPPTRAIIFGAGYESFKLKDAGVDITSEPVVFVKYRYTFPTM